MSRILLNFQFNQVGRLHWSADVTWVYVHGREGMEIEEKYGHLDFDDHDDLVQPQGRLRICVGCLMIWNRSRRSNLLNILHHARYQIEIPSATDKVMLPSR